MSSYIAFTNEIYQDAGSLTKILHVQEKVRLGIESNKPSTSFDPIKKESITIPFPLSPTTSTIEGIYLKYVLGGRKTFKKGKDKKKNKRSTLVP